MTGTLGLVIIVGILALAAIFHKYIEHRMPKEPIMRDEMDLIEYELQRLHSELSSFSSGESEGYKAVLVEIQKLNQTLLNIATANNQKLNAEIAKENASGQ